MGKTQLPDARVRPRFAIGASCTFGRYPRLEDLLAQKQSIDWAIYGVPFDGGVTYRPGARFGPRAIREESQYLKRYSIEHDVDVCEVLSLADAGDSLVAPYSCGQNAVAQHKFAAGLAAKTGVRLLALGGDHTIAYANIKATWEAQGRPRGGLPLVHFDSHLDTVDVIWGEKWSHGSVFRRTIEDGLVDPGRMISIGIKGPLNSRSDLDFAKEHGAEVVTFERYRREGSAIVSRWLKRNKQTPAYFTFDVDCVDPAFAPGTGTPSVGGFSSAQVLEAIRGFAGMKIAGADVVEVLPDRDISGITALLAAHVAFEILCLDALSRGRDNAAPREAARRRRSSKR